MVVPCHLSTSNKEVILRFPSFLAIGFAIGYTNSDE